MGGFLLLGLLGIVICIGGIAGFVGIFSKGVNQAQLDFLEKEIEQLKRQLLALQQKLNASQATQNIAQSKPLADAPIKADIPIEHTQVPAQPAAPSPEAPSRVLPQPEAMAVKLPPVAQTAQKPAKPAEEAEMVRQTTVTQQNSGLDNWLETAKNWLFGGNTLVRAGVVILFIGVAFLVKLAADNNIFPIELRLTGVALLGLGLLGFGWKNRLAKPQFSWALQGGGVGVMYLTIFAAYRLFHLLPAGFAFALLLVIALLSAALAVLQSALPLAILGFSGGFLAPIFTSNGSGNHVGLFSYYLMLNIAIAAIAYFRSWRALNVLGFAFTFVIGTLWGAKNYTPAHFASTEPFLVIHFLLYTAIAVIFAFRQAPKAKDYVDATLVFGTPLVGFSLQYALLRDSHFGLAYSALALGLFYLSLTWWVFKRQHPNLRFLGECFLALGVGFATLAIPLALDGRWTSAAWAVEGVGLLWVGLRQQRTLPTLSGMALQVLAALAFTQGWALTGHSDMAHQNMYLGVAFIALSGWACGALWHRYEAHQTGTAQICAWWGWLWWVGALLTAVDALLPSDYFAHASLGVLALTSVLLPYLASLMRWPYLNQLCRMLLPVMVIGALLEGLLHLFGFANSPLNNAGIIAWPFALLAYAALMLQNIVPNQARWRSPWLWVITAVGIWFMRDGMRYYLLSGIDSSHVWLQIRLAVVPVAVLCAVLALLKKYHQPHLNCTWAWVGGLPLAVGLALWFFGMTLFSNGDATPLPYVPLLNPLDISLASILALLLLWRKQVSAHLHEGAYQLSQYLAGLMAFSLLNGVLLRTLHHWVGTPFEWTAIFNNSTVQVAFTFLWSLSAFALMWLAHKRGMRHLWMVGAALMALVVAKLFLLDLAQHGSVQRIISFMGAGLLLLVMGYFAPLPPARLTLEDTNNDTP